MNSIRSGGSGTPTCMADPVRVPRRTCLAAHGAGPLPTPLALGLVMFKATWPQPDIRLCRAQRHCRWCGWVHGGLRGVFVPDHQAAAAHLLTQHVAVGRGGGLAKLPSNELAQGLDESDS